MLDGMLILCFDNSLLMTWNHVRSVLERHAASRTLIASLSWRVRIILTRFMLFYGVRGSNYLALTNMA